MKCLVPNHSSTSDEGLDIRSTQYTVIRNSMVLVSVGGSGNSHQSQMELTRDVQVKKASTASQGQQHSFSTES